METNEIKLVSELIENIGNMKDFLKMNIKRLSKKYNIDEDRISFLTSYIIIESKNI